MQTTTRTPARSALSHALLVATLTSTFEDLPAAELDALRRAIRAARNENPLDVALVEIAIVADVAAETRTVH